MKLLCKYFNQSINEKSVISRNSELELEFFTFSGGEEYVKINSYVACGDYVIDAKLKTSSDVMRLIMLVNAFRNAAIGKQVTLSLNMFYCPYARQDRICNKGESHSLRAFANIINSLNFDRVFILDPHSDVVGALINNIVIIPQINVFDLFCKTNHDNYTLFSTGIFVSPDAGANKKVQNLAKYYSHKEFIRADKNRELATGKINSVEIVKNAELISGQNVIIADDIADGAGTFVMLAKELKKHNPKSIILYVSHGIFSKGVDCIFESGIDKIYTTDSFNVINHEKIVTAKCAELSTKN